ncbi:MAG TPA: isoleucine--tRNA ligase [Candidatus Nanoarchaeia archaeon]|nr:isoleucine--tRNA ligase [Candidatus Nanoarchaeia archaeon]
MYDAKKIEAEQRRYWKRINLLEKLNAKNRKGERYFLLDGPPYANFIPHVGHIRNTVYKDILIRWNFMKGKSVFFQPGFDTHGLPVENMVEKELKLGSKKDIEKMGIAKFTTACRKLATKNKEVWLDVYDALGSWYAWKEPYLTYDQSYVEAGWWTLKQFHERGLLYEGLSPVFWCPHCETSLAGYEVTDSYKMVTDPCLYVKFKLKTKDEFLLVYTTTPWTLVGNVAIAVHPEKAYAKVETAQGILILAEQRLKTLDELGIAYAKKEVLDGKDLAGMAYEPLLDVEQQAEVAQHKKSHSIVLSIPIMKGRVASKVGMKLGIESGQQFEDFVSMEEGTGLVHVAPGHGKTDSIIGKHYGLVAVSPLDDSCRFSQKAGRFAGIFVKDADKDIAAELEKDNKLLHAGKVQHKYPLCWRCKSPLIFRLSSQWFVAVENLKEKMLKENERVVWQPGFAKERFDAWVMDAEDWNISRQRYWGIPMPIWRCSACNNLRVIESLKELKQHAVGKIPKEFDLHNAAEVELRCSCKLPMQKVRDIADVWFDSGIAPWASLGYPFRNKQRFEQFFPVSRINESQDQIRGWFYSLMFCSVAVHGKSPYKSVSMPGWTVDEVGEKMSKSLGNVILASDALNDLGADVLRFYMMWDAPYEIQKFNKELAKKEVGRMFGILWNIHTYLASQARKIKEVPVAEIEDQWILSRLNTTIEVFVKGIEAFEFQAGKALAGFIVQDVSRGYIQLIRDRVDDGDEAPLFVLYTILLNLVKLLAPVAPFIAEKIYRELGKANGLLDSVHLERIPGSGHRAPDLEKDMELVFELIQALLNVREKVGYGVRWPLKEAIIITPEMRVHEIVKKYEKIIRKQTNMKEISVKEHLAGLKTRVRIDYKKLGPDYGVLLPKIISRLSTESADAVLSHIEKDGKHELLIDGKKVSIVREHLIVDKEIPIHLKEGPFGRGSVYVHRELDNELMAEGFSREIARRVQQMRKQQGLKKSDRIKVHIQVDRDLAKLLEPWTSHIREKVGASELAIAPEAKELGISEKESIKGRDIVFSMER